jgi:hypothetical protein
VWNLSQPKTIKEQMLARIYKRQVERVQERFKIGINDLDVLVAHAEIIHRLDKLPTDSNPIEDETVNTISIYVNGIFVYEEDVQNGCFINALPQYYKNFRTLEICLNDKLITVMSRERVIINFLNPERHPQLVEGLRGSIAWRHLFQAAS